MKLTLKHTFILHSTFLCLCALLVNTSSLRCQSLSENHKDESLILESPTTNKTVNYGIYLNPIDVIYFGPILGFEIDYKHFTGDISIRFPTLGLISHMINDESDGLGSGIGIGISGKYYSNKPKGGLYIGGGLEYWRTHFNLANDDAINNQGLVIAANYGYKFILKSGLYFRAGAYFGTSIIYMDGPDGVFIPVGTIDTAIGYRF